MDNVLDKRRAVKWIRDMAKPRYPKLDYCEICLGTDNLEMHHYVSIYILWEKWRKARKIKDEEVLDYRKQFIAEHDEEIYKHVVTLCRNHHKHLHRLFGPEPQATTLNRQMQWVQKMSEKNGTVQKSAGET